MPTELEKKVIGLLKGGHALSEERRRILIENLGREGRDILRKIASGETTVEHPKLRGKAIIALGFDKGEPEQSISILRTVLSEGEPLLKVKALRSFSRLNPAAIADEARALVRAPDTRPDVALAAARLIPQIGGSAIVQELRELRQRFLSLVPDSSSPSIVSLDQLIAQVEGTFEWPSEEGQPKLEI